MLPHQLTQADTYETEVADRTTMHGAFLHMGYRPTVRVAKVRRTARLEHCSLCVDDVEGVGGFLELERMVPDDVPAEAIQAELAAFVAALLPPGSRRAIWGMKA